MVSLCGGLGAVARFVVDTLIKRASTGSFPWSTLFINTLAGFLFAACVIYLRSYDLNMYVLATSGFLGGFSTFSTAMNEIISLARARHFVDCLVYAVWCIGLPVCAVLVGVALFGALA
ncbi:fluoride efflux transporter FluC [Alloscardovia omnicolens]|uniref:fluoride efflux transporter FluC n=1 Tax=Alloscardovia omnicolens TaxID=419015 RepID=UPI003D725260